MAIKNTLGDLNNHLFEQLERLNDESLTGEAFEIELKRANGMARISSQIILNARLAFDVMAHNDEYTGKVKVPSMLEVHDDK